MALHLTLRQRQQARRLFQEELTQLEIAVSIGCSQRTIERVVPRYGNREQSSIVWSLGPGRLSLEDREEISLGISKGETFRSIASRLGRSPSTISREVKVNGGTQRYRAVQAHHDAYVHARRPKAVKRGTGPLLETVELWLKDL